MDKNKLKKIKLINWLEKKNGDEIHLYDYENIKSSKYYRANDIDMQVIDRSCGYNSFEDKYKDRIIMLPYETNLTHVNHLFKEMIYLIDKHKMKLVDENGLFQDILTLENKESFYKFCMNNS
jgi:hypothetical protein